MLRRQLTPTSPASGCAFSQSTSPNSFIGGAQVGYNYQSGAFVYGIETDLDWRNGQRSSAPFVFNVFGDNDVATSQQNWVGTLRGKLGFTPADRWLAFVSGGLAYGELHHTFIQQWCFLTNAPPFCQASRAISDSVINAGWAIGGGVQYAINNNWSVGAEYLYISLGKDTVTGPTIGPLRPLRAMPTTIPRLRQPFTTILRFYARDWIISFNFSVRCSRSKLCGSFGFCSHSAKSPYGTL